MWRGIGFSSLEDFLVRQWEASFARRDPAELLAQLFTWQHGDISDSPRFRGDLPGALRAISARVLLMPGDQDMYFRVEDNRRELAHLRHGALKPSRNSTAHSHTQTATPSWRTAPLSSSIVPCNGRALHRGRRLDRRRRPCGS